MLVLLLLGSACATPEKYRGEFWVCNALSANEESHRSGGHWGSCQGGEWCAREEALKKCLWKHPKDCEVVSCLKVPEEEMTPSLDKKPTKKGEEKIEEELKL